MKLFAVFVLLAITIVPRLAVAVSISTHKDGSFEKSLTYTASRALTARQVWGKCSNSGTLDPEYLSQTFTVGGYTVSLPHDGTQADLSLPPMATTIKFDVLAQQKTSSKTFGLSRFCSWGYEGESRENGDYVTGYVPGATDATATLPDSIDLDSIQLGSVFSKTVRISVSGGALSIGMSNIYKCEDSPYNLCGKLQNENGTYLPYFIDGPFTVNSNTTILIPAETTELTFKSGAPTESGTYNGTITATIIVP